MGAEFTRIYAPNAAPSKETGRASALTSSQGGPQGLFLYLVFAVIEPSRTNKPAARPLLSR